MTDQEIKNFCYEYRVDYFNADSFIRRFHWSNWNYATFRRRAIKLGCWMNSMRNFSGVYYKKYLA